MNSATFSIGHVLAERYTIQNLLGTGGMAAVYRAQDKATNTEVAVKILHSEQADSEIAQNRLLGEFSLLKELSHSYLVRAYEQHETEDKVPFFTMELIEGVSVALVGMALSNTTSPSQQRPETILTEEQTVDLLAQVAGVLTYLHSQNIIYCDLKPENIILTTLPSEAKEEYRCKLLDVGIAQRLDQRATASRTPNNVTGTSFYMSPEQVRGEPLDCRTDIYSFGVLAYKLLTGAVPFSQPELFSVTASHLIGKATDASHLNPTVPPLLSQLVRVCIAKDPEDRYQSMQEIQKRLSAYQTGRSRSPSLLMRLLRLLAR